MRYALALLIASLAPAAAFEAKVSGAGPRAMILIPGLASGGDVWDTTVERYGTRYQCHVLTLAGFAGVPAEKSQTPLMERTAADVAAYIQANKLQKPVIVGHSLGGVVALMLAAAQPALVGDLVIVDSIPNVGEVFGPGYDAAQWRDRMLKQSRAEYDAFVRTGASVRSMVTNQDYLPRMIDWSLKSDPATVAHAMYEIGTTNLVPRLGKIQARTLVLGTWIGMKEFTDKATVEGNFRRQYKGLAGVQVVMTDTARHFIMWDDPAWFFAQVDGFLKP
jgi:pimeloyl-ACP methyl ester carboxylesterase